MDLQFKNKVIIVTDGAKGIGAGIVEVLAEEGALPVIIAPTQEDNESLIARLKLKNQEVGAVVAELSDPEQCKEAVNKVVEQYGRIDGLINNAGTSDRVRLASGSHDDFVKWIHQNLIHYFLVTQAALPELIKSKGSIVNIGSKTADTGHGGISAYAVNGGRNAFTREWSVELLQHGIRVNSVIVMEWPTLIDEEWLKTFPGPKAAFHNIKSKISIGNRIITPHEIANVVVFLLSERSSHTVGQIITCG